VGVVVVPDGDDGDRVKGACEEQRPYSASLQMTL
jgi:hypothetical protein